MDIYPPCYNDIIAIDIKAWIGHLCLSYDNEHENKEVLTLNTNVYTIEAAY